jgi:hypothetical protein
MRDLALLEVDSGKENYMTKKEVFAAFRAATAKPEFLTADKLDAGLGGWGAFNIAIWAACDVIALEIRKGKKLKLSTADVPHTDIDEIAKKAVDTLMQSGVNVQCGMPCPNKKLGAVTRMAAGIPSGRVQSIPTEKQNNKISGFAATLAIYNAIASENLAPYDSHLLPLGAGGPIIGHSAIGEDHLFPKLGQKLADIGTRAMIKSYLSVGMKPNKWHSALMGTAATLEIIHPDAYVGEEFGRFSETRTPETAAEAAVRTAELPEIVHIRGINKEVKTAQVVGDLAIILKDSGTPTVVGMIMFSEICSILSESGLIGAGRAAGPLVIPIHHWVTSPVLALYMTGAGASEEEIIVTIKKTLGQFFQKDDAIAATNLLARKAESIQKGPISETIIRATEPGLTNAIAKKTVYAYEKMSSGTSLTQLIKDVQDRKIQSISQSVAKAMSKKMGRDIEYIKLKNVRPGSGRRSHASAVRHFAFDAYVDAEVKIDGKVYELENVLAKAAPEALMKGDKETLNAISSVSLAVIELLCGGACSMDVVVCACTAAAMGTEPSVVIKEALEAADVMIAIPPSVGIKKAVQLAADIVSGME